jgi:mRNA interferase MazF
VNRRGDFPEDVSQIAYAAAFIEWLGEEASASMKPASVTPFSALALCELAERAGVPKGIFSCITGPSNEIGSRSRPRYVLADWLKDITPEAMRDAFDWGPDKGSRDRRVRRCRMCPRRGDLIWTDRSQAGRPTSRAGCLTRRFLPPDRVSDRLSDYLPIRPFGTSLVLPLGLPVSGEILTSHVRRIDMLAHPISYAGAAVPAATLDDVRSKLAAVIGL